MTTKRETIYTKQEMKVGPRTRTRTRTRRKWSRTRTMRKRRKRKKVEEERLVVGLCGGRLGLRSKSNILTLNCSRKP